MQDGFSKAAISVLYLMASGFTAVAVGLWMGAEHGWLTHRRIDPLWFAHEAIFGVLAAVLTGFVYQRARVWSALGPSRGVWLALIGGTWLAGRGAMWMAPGTLAAAVDCAFLCLTPLPLYRVLKQSHGLKHIVFVELLCLLALLNFLYHVTSLGLSSISARHIVILAAIVSALLVCLTARSFLANCNAVQCRCGHRGVDKPKGSTR